MSTSHSTQFATAVNTPLLARTFARGTRVSINAPGFFHGQRGTVRRGYVAGGIQSYYVEGEFGIVAFDWYELVEA